MNVIGLLFLFLIAVAAVFGLYAVANSQTDVVINDTYGNTLSTASNATQDVIQNTTATGLTVASGLVLFIAFIIMLVVLIALVAVATRKF